MFVFEFLTYIVAIVCIVILTISGYDYIQYCKKIKECDD